MIPHIEPYFDENEAVEVGKLIMSGSWLTEYVKTRELEAVIAKYLKTDFCYMYPNGTLAIYAACVALGIGPGDEVIVPDLTMIASATAVSMTGATCVFVDVDPVTLCISSENICESITPNTKAIVSVDLNGRSPNYGAELYWLKENIGLYLIEDAAQAFGSKDAQEYPLGTWGDIGCFSFSPHKIITTGQGGCCVTDKPKYADALRLYRNFGRKESGGFEHDSIGINLKFTDLQAVIGLEQFKKLERRIKRKKEIFEMYRDNLSCVSFLPTNLSYITPWYVDIFTDKRDLLYEYLLSFGIRTQKMYPIVSSTKAYSIQLNNPVSIQASETGLFLPSSVTLTDEEIAYVCSKVSRFIGGRS